jgi:hypothetical protein
MTPKAKQRVLRVAPPTKSLNRTHEFILTHTRDFPEPLVIQRLVGGDEHHGQNLMPGESLYIHGHEISPQIEILIAKNRVAKKPNPHYVQPHEPPTASKSLSTEQVSEPPSLIEDTELTPEELAALKAEEQLGESEDADEER